MRKLVIAVKATDGLDKVIKGYNENIKTLKVVQKSITTMTNKFSALGLRIDSTSTESEEEGGRGVRCFISYKGLDYKEDPKENQNRSIEVLKVLKESGFKFASQEENGWKKGMPEADVNGIFSTNKSISISMDSYDNPNLNISIYISL